MVGFEMLAQVQRDLTAEMVSEFVNMNAPQSESTISCIGCCQTERTTRCSLQEKELLKFMFL